VPTRGALNVKVLRGRGRVAECSSSQPPWPRRRLPRGAVSMG